MKPELGIISLEMAAKFFMCSSSSVFNGGFLTKVQIILDTQGAPKVTVETILKNIRRVTLKRKEDTGKERLKGGDPKEEKKKEKQEEEEEW